MKKHKTPVKDEAQKIQESILMREVDEQLHKEKMLNLWQRYRFLFYSTIAAVFIVVTGSQMYYAWSQKVALEDSNQFEKALLLTQNGKKEQAITTYQSLIDTANTNYKYLAQLRIASLYLDFDKEKAIKILNDVANNKKAPQSLRDIALITYVGQQIGFEDPAILQQKLAPLLVNKQANYIAAIELQAILLLVQNKLDDAILLLQDTLKQPDLPPESIERVNIILSVIAK